MSKQSEESKKQATITQVEAEMSKLTPQEKVAYCAEKRCKYLFAQNKAQEILTRVDKETQDTCGRMVFFALGMCVPMAVLSATTGIPVEVGRAFGAGMIICVGHGAISCILKSSTHKRIASQLSTLETAHETAVSVCDNSPEVQEYKDSVLAEFGVQQSK